VATPITSITTQAAGFHLDIGLHEEDLELPRPVRILEHAVDERNRAHLDVAQNGAVDVLLLRVRHHVLETVADLPVGPRTGNHQNARYGDEHREEDQHAGNEDPQIGAEAVKVHG
jgi:hypothetical protein